MPARQRPNSMLEWMAGRNIPTRPSRSSHSRGVLKLQVFTDDIQETDTLAVTYPRTGNTHGTTLPRRTASKQVAFTEEPQQAVVKSEPFQRPVDSDLEVETSGSEESVEVVKIIKRKKRTKKVSPPATPVAPPEPAPVPPPPPAPVTPAPQPACLKELPVPPESTNDDDGDIEPHPSCPCPTCLYGRKLLRRARRKNKINAEPEGETAASKSPAVPPAAPADSDNKGYSTRATGETAPKVTENAPADDDAANTKEAPPAEPSPPKAPPVAVVSTCSRNSKIQPLPNAYPPSAIRNPNLIVPPRAEVIQIEHAVETPADPRPNAFVDNEHGICRVYHGPAYGNPYGSLYPRRGLSGAPPFQPLPAGVPHPMHNPYYNGFDPVQMEQHGQPPPPVWPPGLTHYVPPPPPIPGYPPAPPPETAPPMHMPWRNYQVAAEGGRNSNGRREHSGHKKVPSPIVPPVAPPFVPQVMPTFVPPTIPPAPPPAGPPVEEPSKAAPADQAQPQQPNNIGFSHASPPFGLLTPRTIAARFSDKPTSSTRGRDNNNGWGPSSIGKDKDQGWGNNVGPKSPSHKSGSRHKGSNGGGNGGWGATSGGPSNNNNNNGWGHNSPRASNKDIAASNGWGGNSNAENSKGSHHSDRHGSRRSTSPKNDGWGGGGNNDGANDNWGAGSQRSGSKKSSNHSRNSANQPAEDIGGAGWGGGWGDTAGGKSKSHGNGNGNGNGWGGNDSPRGSNSGGSNRDKGSDMNGRNNNGWGDGDGNGNGNGRGGSGSNHRHSNSPPSGNRHASGGAGGNRQNPPRPPRAADNRDGRDHRHSSGNHQEHQHSRHKSSSRMPGSWESIPSNNAGPQGTPGVRGRGHSSPPRAHRSGDGKGCSPGGRHRNSGSVHGGTGAFGGFEGTWNGGTAGGGGSGPSWGDPTAAQSTKVSASGW